MFDRTDEDIALGVIRLRLGEQAFVLPTLSWADSEEWQARAWETVSAVGAFRLDTVNDVSGVVAGAMGSIVDLVAAYDREHKLGKDARDLKSRYDRSQLYEVFKAIARHEFPFLRDAQEATTALLPMVRPILYQWLAAASSRQQSSSSGASPTGDSTLAASDRDSTDSSSASSGTPVNGA